MNDLPSPRRPAFSALLTWLSLGINLVGTTSCTGDLAGGMSGGETSKDDEGTPSGTATGGNTGTPLDETPVCTDELHPGDAPLRRLTRFEYNNTVEQLLGDTSRPGDTLPPELSGNGFGNDAAQQPVSSFLAEQYGIVAEKAAQRAVQDPAVMERYAPCFSTVSAESEESCALSFIQSFLSAAFRRPLQPGEAEEWLELQSTLRPLSDFSDSLAGVIETALQSPDFLYRVEFGEPDAEDPSVLRPTGHEMASRLSYFFWGSPPDTELETDAAAGNLSHDEGILAAAQRLLNDERARPMIRFFFNRLLPIEGLTDLSRDPEQYPDFSPTIGALMHEETHTFLEHEIFEGPGDWPSALTAPYTFVNETLADYYGIEGVTGDDFQKVEIDTQRRLGLLTQGSILAGSTVSNFTNPVRRGVFLLRHIMCAELPEPPAAIAEQIMPPDPYSGSTGRQRYSAHSQQPVCANCHALMDPPGFALENYDAAGQWRDQENGVTIDASGQISSLPEAFDGPVALVRLLSESPETQACFAHHWLTFAYGRTLDEKDDVCLEEKVVERFAEANFNIKELLVLLTQTDDFLYMTPRGQN